MDDNLAYTMATNQIEPAHLRFSSEELLYYVQKTEGKRGQRIISSRAKLVEPPQVIRIRGPCPASHGCFRIPQSR